MLEVGQDALLVEKLVEYFYGGEMGCVHVIMNASVYLLSCYVFPSDGPGGILSLSVTSLIPLSSM